MNIINKYIIYNFIGFLIIGINGILLNIFILTVYNIKILGIFNFYLSFIIILSQFCVGGIQFSVLKHNTNFLKRLSEISKSLSSALFVSTLLSIIILSILYLSSSFLKLLFNLENFELLILLILPAIFFFTLNKILLMSLNGLNLMMEYSVFNALRYIILFLSVVCFYLFDLNEKYLIVTLSLGELVLFLLLSIFTYKKILIFKFPRINWMKRHISFGLKGMWGGALMEVNTRVDILMIGSFLGYGAVGIYSFASMIAEGFAQVYTVLKNNVDPIFGNAYFKSNYNLIEKTIKDIRKMYIPFIIIFGILVIVLYKPIFIYLFNLDVSLIENSWEILIVLISFMICASYYRPFLGLLNQINKPAKFSQIILVTGIINYLLNLLLIPYYGVIGAAFSTGIVFVIESYLAVYVAKKYLK